MAFEKKTPAADRNIMASFWIVMWVLVAVALMPLAERYEADAFPVVSEFRVAHMRDEGDAVVVSGDMKKERDCEFLSLTFYAGDPDDMDRPRERLNVTFLDQPANVDASRLPGRQPWGPWRISKPQNRSHPRVFMRVNHDCHPLWHTSSTYLDVPVAELFGPHRDSGAEPEPTQPPDRDRWGDAAP